MKKKNVVALRMAVARDVIKSLKSGFMSATPGTYCELEMALGTVPIGQELSEHLKDVKHCEVCAIGAAFISLVKLDNEYILTKNRLFDTGSFSINDNEMRARLVAIFSAKQLAAMETAFECSAYVEDFAEYQMDDGDEVVRSDNGTIKDSRNFRKIARRMRVCNETAFGMRYRDPKDRLVGIMENVLKNKGKFKAPRI